MNKFLTGVFIVLLLVFFAEIGYLFYGPGAKESSSKPPATEIKVLPSATPKTPITTDEKQAITQSTINRFADLKIFKKGVLQSTTVKHVLEGKITEIKKPSEIIKDSAEMANFTIEGKEGLKNSFFFSEKEVSNMKIFQDKEKQSPIYFEALKIGDNINLQFDINIYAYTNDVGQEEQIITIIVNP